MKKLLFISPDFFEYTTSIQKYIEKQNVMVTYLNTQPIFIGRFLHRLPKSIKQNCFDLYFRHAFKILSRESFDYVYIINGAKISRDVLSSFREKQKAAKFLLHCWDSIDNNVNALEITELFDDSTSFDYRDCRNYGFRLKENFYLPQFENLRNSENIVPKYTLMYIGSYTKERYYLLEQLADLCKQEGEEVYFHLYIGRIGYIIESLKQRKSLRKDLCRFNKINLKKMLNFMNKSKCVLDIVGENQVGQTMRVFECLAANRKLLTTNKHLIETPYYNPQEMKILNVNELNLIFEWLKDNSRCHINDIKKFSIESWVSDIFRM